MLDQITPLVLTYNEAPNIKRTLEKLSWAKQIVLVDSFSNDETIKLAKQMPQVHVFQRKFDNHTNQSNYGLHETNIQTKWVLALDADFILTPEFLDEINSMQNENGV